MKTLITTDMSDDPSCSIKKEQMCSVIWITLDLDHVSS